MKPIKKKSKKLKLLYFRVLAFFTDWRYTRFGSIDIILVYALLTWIFEWVYVLNVGIGYWTFSRFIFPFRTPFMLMVVFSYWLYVWGISVWRRTQYGKFTRGDRKLWAKGFASFWVSEFLTIGGVFIAICWMSWGPIALIPRVFFVPKKNFLIELTIFTYVVWIIYIMRLSLKWQLWKTQYLLTWTIVVVLSYLMWRDFILLYSREVVTVNQGARWRHLKVGSIVYSLHSYWWLQHYYGPGRHIETPFMPLSTFIGTNFSENPFSVINLNTEYDRYTRMPFVQPYEWGRSAFPNTPFGRSVLRTRISKLAIYNLRDLQDNGFFGSLKTGVSTQPIDSWIAHPRRYGFMPKKISMWYFLIYLKIWHHLILFIWWFLFLIRLHGRKKSSFNFLASCYFNVYCCFLIGLLVYCYQYLKHWEIIFKFKPARAPCIMKSRIQTILGYYQDVVFNGEFLWKRPKESLVYKYKQYYKFFDLAYFNNSPLDLDAKLVKLKFKLSVEDFYLKRAKLEEDMVISEDFYYIWRRR